MRQTHINGSDERAAWVKTAADVLFGVLCVAGVVGTFIVAAVVFGLIWMAVKW